MQNTCGSRLGSESSRVCSHLIKRDVRMADQKCCLPCFWQSCSNKCLEAHPLLDVATVLAALAPLLLACTFLHSLSCLPSGISAEPQAEKNISNIVVDVQANQSLGGQLQTYLDHTRYLRMALLELNVALNIPSISPPNQHSCSSVALLVNGLSFHKGVVRRDQCHQANARLPQLNPYLFIHSCSRHPFCKKK
jgi:hypothetical protein